MTDTRELILERIKAILGTLGAGTVTRNRGELDVNATTFPALMMLDSDEISASLFDPALRVQRPSRSAALDMVEMKPEIYIQLKPTKPHNEQMGPQLNEWRANVVSAIILDSELRALVGQNGSIAYHGCETDLGRTRDLAGMMRVNIAILYVLRVADLAIPSP